MLGLAWINWNPYLIFIHIEKYLFAIVFNSILNFSAWWHGALELKTRHHWSRARYRLLDDTLISLPNGWLQKNSKLNYPWAMGQCILCGGRESREGNEPSDRLPFSLIIHRIFSANFKRLSPLRSHRAVQSKGWLQSTRFLRCQ